MVIPSTLLDEIGQSLQVDRETLITQGIVSLLKEKKRLALLDRLERLGCHGVESREALEQAIHEGAIVEHPAWEDLIVLENLDAEIARIDGYLQHL
jgi:hypothetical protein